MEKKRLIYGGILLLFGVGAYLWYRKSKGTKDYEKHLADYKANALALAVSKNQQALTTTDRTNIDSISVADWGKMAKNVDWSSNKWDLS